MLIPKNCYDSVYHVKSMIILYIKNYFNLKCLFVTQKDSILNKFNYILRLDSLQVRTFYKSQPPYNIGRFVLIVSSCIGFVKLP